MAPPAAGIAIFLVEFAQLSSSCPHSVRDYQIYHPLESNGVVVKYMGSKHQATVPLWTEGNLEKLRDRGLPECNTDEEIALLMGISVEKLRFLAFNHSNTSKHYFHFPIQKKTGVPRIISAPRPNLKAAQNGF